MPKFRKKPVEVEAIQITRENLGEIWYWGEGIFNAGDHLRIKTLEGEMKGEIGDWLITGVNGEKYPCKPDIFEKTYDKVEEQS